jgi:hypothetical protein
MSYTLEDIYFLKSKVQLRKWVGPKYTDGGLYDRLIATIKLYNKGQTDPRDDPYIEDPQFNTYYLQSETELGRQIHNIDPDLDLTTYNHMDRIRWLIDEARRVDQSGQAFCQTFEPAYVDATGLQIFDTFVKKYSANNIFGRARARVKFLFQTKVLLPIDRDKLGGIIREFETLYDQFIQRVYTERLFYEKSGAGKGPRKIITPQDWAEAIIELQDTANKFEQILNDHINNYTQEQHLRVGCEKASYAACSYPCSPVKNIIRAGGKCIYKR